MASSHCLARKEAIVTLKIKRVPLPSNIKAQSTVGLFENKKEAHQRERGKEKKNGSEVLTVEQGRPGLRDKAVINHLFKLLWDMKWCFIQIVKRHVSVCSSPMLMLMGLEKWLVQLPRAPTTFRALGKDCL